MIRRGVLLGVLWGALTAATPLPLKPPPPDLAPLIPWAAAPVDKPPVPLPAIALPLSAVDVPPVPPALPLAPADKPVAPIPPPRRLPCVGAWLGIASESLECGRARFQRGELDDAAKALEQAVRAASDRDLLAEARYWLGETYWRLGRPDQADPLFRQVAQDQARGELGPWARHSSGWTALRLGDAARARDAFTQLLAAPQPLPLDTWGRHGLALALYTLGRYDDAVRTWGELAQRAVPAGLARDVAFWSGDALGRTGQYAPAEERLTRFTEGGPHPLLDTGWLRRGWWALAGGHAAQSVGPFRTYLASTSARNGATERDWGDAGLALAFLDGDDWDGAREAARALEARRPAIGVPVLLRLAAAAVAKSRAAEAQTLVQQVLTGTLAPPVRAWALAVNGDAFRVDGNRDDARTQYELAHDLDPTSATGRYASLRMAQMNFELREFAQAVSDLAPLAEVPLASDLRAAVLILQGEAAYAAGDQPTAAAAYRRALVEFPDRPEAPALRLALAWTALRQGQRDDARRQFLEFAAGVPAEDPRGVDALVLASELALADGSLDAGRELLDRVIATAPTHPRTDFARLNRGFLALRTGDHTTAQTVLGEWLRQAPFPPLVGRAHAALGVSLLETGKPADAAREFAAARKEGLTALPTLGLGVAALVENRTDDAAKLLQQARDEGAASVAAAAEYGLAVLAFDRGDRKGFRQTAAAMLRHAPHGPGAPALLYVLTGLAAEDKDWPNALADARRLATDFADADVADDGLFRAGAGAAEAHVWPVAYDALGLLRQRFPASPFVEDSRVTFAEAQVETGHAADARQSMEAFVNASPADPRAGRALLVLARAREATGDRAGALQAYGRAAQDGTALAWSGERLLDYGRLLAQDHRWSDARPVLERALQGADAAKAGAVAVALGDTYEGEAQHLAAAEYYMTAAYLAPESPEGRRAMLAAARAFAALKQGDAAAIVYRKLLAQSGVPGDLADAARQGLTELTPAAGTAR